MAKPKLLTVFKDGDYAVELFQTSANKYMVLYGADQRPGLTWLQAAHEFGECVFHSLQCAGKIDRE